MRLLYEQLSPSIPSQRGLLGILLAVDIHARQSGQVTKCWACEHGRIRIQLISDCTHFSKYDTHVDGQLSA